MLLGFFLSFCNNEASVTIKEDTLEKKSEELGKRADSMGESLKDSAKSRWKEIRNKVEQELENTDTNSK